MRECEGGPDIAVGCAGTSGPMGKAPTDISRDEFARTLEVNLTGQFLLAKHAGAAMRERGGGAVVFVPPTRASSPLPAWPRTAPPRAGC